FGFVDEGVISADTTAQELPIGYPNEPGILRGLSQRCGRALKRTYDHTLTLVQDTKERLRKNHLPAIFTDTFASYESALLEVF
ncbi:hypothetical protein C2W62_54120, partial [Candidatus Entotheonella serta]